MSVSCTLIVNYFLFPVSPVFLHVQNRLAFTLQSVSCMLCPRVVVNRASLI